MSTTIKRHSAILGSLLVLICISVDAQAQNKNVPWTEWSKKYAEKVLTDSPWAQTQVDTNLSEMFYSPTSQGANAPNRNTRSVEGAVNQEMKLTYHIRFFSARPIRQALTRLYQIQNPEEQKNDRLKTFAELESKDSIILTVTFESPDGRFSGKVMQAFNSAVTAILKNKTYLERNDGSRLFLSEYVPPGRDGFGARFIFARDVEGKPFLDQNAREVRFFCEYNEGLILNMRFKVSDMIYNGQLEY
ncbi:MAG TPA: hypothetical protein VIG25_21355 [Pyrinomonadaceae bacterium]|jgi:hypothetical protein